MVLVSSGLEAKFAGLGLGLEPSGLGLERFGLDNNTALIQDNLGEPMLSQTTDLLEQPVDFL